MYKTDYKEFCRVITWAAICQRILSYPSSSLDSLVHTWYNKKNSRFKFITSNLIRVQLQSSVSWIGKETLGFDPWEIGCHSIRSAFAMALVLINTHFMTIMIAGQWKSNTFLKYVSKQIATFTVNLSKNMLQNKDFFTVPRYNDTPSSAPPKVVGPLNCGVFRFECLLTAPSPS